MDMLISGMCSVQAVAVNNGLIDMYGKSGNIDSMTKLFNSMGKRDLFSWTSMISGLALHGMGKDALVFTTRCWMLG